jgi:hypothetical protein
MKTSTLVIFIVLACGGLFLALVAACAGFFYYTYQSMDVSLSPKIDALFAAIDDGTFGETYETIAAAELRHLQTKAKYEETGQIIKARLGSLRSKSRTQFNIQQVNATTIADVAYSAVFEKGKGTILAQFKTVGGQWRLTGFRVNSPEFEKALVTEKCPHCGEAHPASSKFCPSCGKPLTPTEEVKTREPATDAQEQKQEQEQKQGQEQEQAAH